MILAHLLLRVLGKKVKLDWARVHGRWAALAWKCRGLALGKLKNFERDSLLFFCCILRVCCCSTGLEVECRWVVKMLARCHDK